MTIVTPTDRAGSTVNGVASETERVDVVVIGGGQAGLAAGYHLPDAGSRSSSSTRTIASSMARPLNAGRIQTTSACCNSLAWFLGQSRFRGKPYKGRPR